MSDAEGAARPSPSAERVHRYLQQHGLADGVVHFDRSTRTAALAAEAVSCELGQIVKSLVFLADRPLLVLVAGDRRGDTESIAAAAGAPQARMADADEVRQATGYAIGGVSPFDLPEDIEVLVDESLGRFDVVYTAAGTPSSVVRIETAALVELCRGRMACVAG
jgi:prolyl-tRNA editing enzyme YbaK/EbsC (Cys-tRNA(Pro) deacylase)